MSKKEIISLIILIAVVSYGAWQFFNSSFTKTKSQHLMDTVVNITATSKSKNIGATIDSVFAYIQKMEQKLDEYSPESLLWQINHSSEVTFPMDADLYQLMVIADSLYKITDGHFDPTIKPVFDLWGFGNTDIAALEPQQRSVPDTAELANALELVDWNKIRFDQNKLHKPVAMKLTFGAIAKGYILDKAREYMKSLDVISGNIDCRSSMTFFGGKLFQQVYIQHPMLKQDDFIASFKIKDGSIGTSGNYQQYFEIDNVRYHHIIDPFTGYPTPDVYSSTVIHPSAAWADGLSTALFLLAPERAIEIAKTIPNCEAVIYCQQEDQTISFKTMGMKDLAFSEKL